MEDLRELIISEAPQLQYRLSFNILAYKGRRDVCFIWPASVLWGGMKTYEGVRFGYSYGPCSPPPPTSWTAATASRCTCAICKASPPPMGVCCGSCCTKR